MNKREKDEISYLPEKYKPLGAWGYFGYTILFSLPLIGFICLIIFSFNDSNINRRSFARSYFCAILVGFVVALIMFFAVGGTLMAYLQEILQNMPQ